MWVWIKNTGFFHCFSSCVMTIQLKPEVYIQLGGWTRFEFEVSSVASEGQYKKKKRYLDKIRKIYTSLNACLFILEHPWAFEPSVIVAIESLSCLQGEKMDLKIIQSLLERVQIHKKRLKTKGFVGAEGFFWRTAASFNVKDKKGTNEQLSLNKQTNNQTKNSCGSIS